LTQIPDDVVDSEDHVTSTAVLSADTVHAETQS
jgi:hypothetical protein